MAIALARASQERAATADERGTALNDLGTALATLGQREPGTVRLEHAVTAYRDALKERTRDRVPLQWAMTQMNLAIAELALHRKAPDPGRLAKARTRVVEARAIVTEGAPRYVEIADDSLAAIDTALRDD